MRVLRRGDRVDARARTGRGGDVSRRARSSIAAHRERRVIEKLKSAAACVSRRPEARREELELDEGNARMHARVHCDKREDGIGE